MGLRPMSQKSLSIKLGERGYANARTGGGGRVSYQGIALAQPIHKEYLWQYRLTNNPDVWQKGTLIANEPANAKQLLTEIYGQNSVLEVAPGWLKVR